VLTNFPEVSKNFQKLKDLEEKLVSPEEKQNIQKRKSGNGTKKDKDWTHFIRNCKHETKTGCHIYVDSHLENLAVKEALSVGVPTVAIVDTNADPFLVSYPIPANDDAVGSIKINCRLCDGCLG